MTAAKTVKSEPPSPIPPLVAGDRLTRDEFERRYEAMPEIKKAELIEGVVYVVTSPVSHGRHGKPTARILGWLTHYLVATPGVDVGDNSSVRLDLDNEPQPDALLRILPASGGQSGDEDEYVAGAPELVVEVSASSASYDLHDKKNAYRRNGVREYVVWRVDEDAIDWFVLRGGRYEDLVPGEDGIVRSECFPGLWLDAGALLADDLARVLVVLDQGTKTGEHGAFVRELANRGGR